MDRQIAAQRKRSTRRRRHSRHILLTPNQPKMLSSPSTPQKREIASNDAPLNIFKRWRKGSIQLATLKTVEKNKRTIAPRSDATRFE
jgi:hypothetical protein